MPTEDEVDNESEPLDPEIYSDGRPLKSSRGQVFIDCPECDASFPVNKRTDPLPNHRGFRSPAKCKGSGNPVK
jgi:hypothetical protein